MYSPHSSPNTSSTVTTFVCSVCLKFLSGFRIPNNARICRQIKAGIAMNARRTRPGAPESDKVHRTVKAKTTTAAASATLHTGATNQPKTNSKNASPTWINIGRERVTKPKKKRFQSR